MREWRVWAATVLVMLALSHPALYGATLPFDGTTLLTLAVSVGYFIGYVYLIRTLLRLPFALWRFRRRFIHARKSYQLSRNEALIDAFYGGLLDRKAFEGGVIALLDRLAVLLIGVIACLPAIGGWLVGYLGGWGALLLVFVYVYTGRFSLLVGDGEFGGRAMPKLRRPPDDIRF
ncbi:MAG: hypothetical protein ACOYL5_17870 [Phototrophicaceae bacterium]